LQPLRMADKRGKSRKLFIVLHRCADPMPVGRLEMPRRRTAKAVITIPLPHMTGKVEVPQQRPEHTESHVVESDIYDLSSSAAFSISGVETEDGSQCTSKAGHKIANGNRTTRAHWWP